MYLQKKSSFKETFFESGSVKNLRCEIKRICNLDRYTVLVTGDSGAGKEIVIKLFREQSKCNDTNFVIINCGELTDETLSSELFGHRKGAFTDAKEARIGLLTSADGGTVIFDEIENASSKMQKSILRFLEHGEIRPNGSNETLNVCVNVIALTNVDLEEAYQRGQFRKDLFFRLTEYELHLPDLYSQGKAEISNFINYFITEYSSRYNRDPITIDKGLLNFLLEYQYPGGIRELDHLIKQFYVRALSMATAADLPLRYQSKPNTKNLSQYNPPFSKLSEMNRFHVNHVLKDKGYNKTKAAEALGIAVNTLKKYLD